MPRPQSDRDLKVQGFPHLSDLNAIPAVAQQLIRSICSSVQGEGKVLEKPKEVQERDSD